MRAHYYIMTISLPHDLLVNINILYYLNNILHYTTLCRYTENVLCVLKIIAFEIQHVTTTLLNAHKIFYNMSSPKQIHCSALKC